MPIHLKPSMASLLAAMRDGVVLRLSYATGKYFLVRPDIHRCTLSAKGLERRGMIERYDETLAGCKFRLSSKALDYYKGNK